MTVDSKNDLEVLAKELLLVRERLRPLKQKEEEIRDRIIGLAGAIPAKQDKLFNFAGWILSVGRRSKRGIDFDKMAAKLGEKVMNKFRVRKQYVEVAVWRAEIEEVGDTAPPAPSRRTG